MSGKLFAFLFLLSLGYAFVMTLTGGSDDSQTESKHHQERTKEEILADINSRAEKEAEKRSMDLFLNIADKYNWTEDDVKNAVTLLKDLGVKFETLQTFVQQDISFEDPKDNKFSSGRLFLEIEGNKISKVYVNLYSGINGEKDLKQIEKNIDAPKHKFVRDFYLYINDKGQNLSRKEFDKIYFPKDRIQALEQNIVKNYLQKSEEIQKKGGFTGEIDQFHLSLGVDVGHVDSITDKELINSKIVYVCSFVYSVKSKVYGKDKEDFYTKVFIDDDELIVLEDEVYTEQF